jgi:4-hydroxy-tetrahydrodipicolinate synthase
MALTSSAAGVYPIAPTAFHDDGRIDADSMARLTDHYVAIGATGLTVLGQLGEAPKLSHEESVAITRDMVRRAPGLPVIAGVTSPGFAPMRALAQEVMAAGAAGVMIAPPHTLRTDDQIVTYYRQASEAIGADIPVVLQDYPLTFSVQMTPGVIRRIVQEVPAVVMRHFEREGSMRRIAILCGNGGLFLDFELSRGADGANTGYCFPELLCDVVRLHKEGRRDEAHDLFDAHLPLLRYEQQPGAGLAVRKHVLQRRGLIASAAQRRPGAALSPAAVQEVEYLLARLARKDPRARVPSV